MKFCYWMVLILSLSVPTGALANNLQGTWELVSGEYIDHQGQLQHYDKLGLKSIKILSENHFSFVTMAGDKFWSAGSGTFQFSENEYSENPIYTSYTISKGQQYRFKFTLKGNTWINARWENGVRVEYEVWRRKD